MAACTIKRMLSGIDTAQVAYYLRPVHGAQFSFERLFLEKEKLRAGNGREEKLIEFGGRTFALQRYGSPSGFPFVLKNAVLAIECGENNTPGFFVTYRSEALWQFGARALHEQFMTWAQSVGLIAFKAESLSRVDFAFDYLFPAVDFTEDSVVSLSTKDAQYRENGTLQTLTFGRSDIVLRIYDKVAEIAQQSDKVWLFQLWGVAENVWRVEWQVRKDVLRRFGIRTFADLFEGQGDVLRYLATEHDSLRVPNGDSNRSRWPMHELWRDLLEHVAAFKSQGVYRDIDAQAALNERLLRMAVSVYGYLKRIAAITSVQHAEDFVSLATAEERLRDLVRRVHEPMTWRLDVQAKREQERVGNLQ